MHFCVLKKSKNIFGLMLKKQQESSYGDDICSLFGLYYMTKAIEYERVEEHFSEKPL
jgi:hypothetical protein